MIKKLTLLVGAGAGYVLGSKAGRERYDDIVAQAKKLMGSPQAQKVGDTLHQTAGDLADKATTVAASAADSVKDKTVDLTQSKPAVTSSTAPMAGAAPSGSAPDTI